MMKYRLSNLPALSLATILLVAWLAACRPVAEPTPEADPVDPVSSPTVEPTATMAALPARPLADYAAAAPLQLDVLAVDGQTIHVQQPAYMAVEWASPNDATAATYVTQDDGQGQRLVHYQALPGSAGPGDVWSPGVHQAFATWPAEEPYLTDQVQGDYVLLVPATVGEGTELAIAGRYRPSNSTDYVDVELSADPQNWQIGPLRETASGTEIQPAPGDEFQLINQYLNGERRPGLSLFFEPEGRLTFQQLLLPDGDYRFGISVKDAAGRSQEVTTDLVVDNSNLRIAHRAYLDPYLGYQFHYPADWPVPAYRDGRLTAGDSAGQTQLTVSQFPGQIGRTARQLQEEALAQLGPVQSLFEDEIALAGSGGLWLAYGYEREDGPRTGILLTFVHEGTGYAVDIDGPAAGEAETLTLVQVLAESWTFRPVTFGRYPGKWLAAGNGDFSLIVPADFYQAELGNGWWRYSGGDGVTFLAVRADAERDPAAAAGHWAEVAGRDVPAFRASQPYGSTVAGRSGWQVDFTYEGSDGQPVSGVIWAVDDKAGSLVMWAEAPTERYEAFIDQVFLIGLVALEPA